MPYQQSNLGGSGELSQPGVVSKDGKGQHWQPRHPFYTLWEAESMVKRLTWSLSSQQKGDSQKPLNQGRIQRTGAEEE